MARPIWSGTISFGLVNIPIKLYTAVRDHSIHFNMLHDQDHARLQRKMVCSVDGKEVHQEHTVKGYEISPEHYVVLTQQDMESVAPEKNNTIEISDFVPLESIDPIYFDHPYYVAPGERAGKAYHLLHEAMEKTGKVGIARFVMREKEYLAVIRPLGEFLCLETMHFKDEVTKPEDLPGGGKSEVNAKELEMARKLVDSLAKDFDPDDYKDDYQERVLEMIKKKSHGAKIAAAPVQQKSAKAADLLSALQASLADAGRRTPPVTKATRAKKKKTA
jgi:DNA end-binding protein Ku